MYYANFFGHDNGFISCISILSKLDPRISKLKIKDLQHQLWLFLYQKGMFFKMLFIKHISGYSIYFINRILLHKCKKNVVKSNFKSLKENQNGYFSSQKKKSKRIISKSKAV